MRIQIWVTLSYRTLVLHEEEEIDPQTLPSSQGIGSLGYHLR